MKNKVFLDTNVLVYSIDSDARKKRDVARTLLGNVFKEGNGFLSTQVLQEFFVAATRKLGMEPLEAKELIRAWGRYNVITVTREIIEEAVDISILNRLSYWDGAIIASARAAGCGVLYTEDLSHEQVIGGVRIENPFA
ncbi:MAG TPA: PIN domain-containing protein [Spirochaetota bacterium]|nr:PIN domain-containing protein [Spirochaetota bacterium]